TATGVAIMSSNTNPDKLVNMSILLITEPDNNITAAIKPKTDINSVKVA
ncbi:unnamed protein product, partial [marine sediment metagenome]